MNHNLFNAGSNVLLSQLCSSINRNYLCDSVAEKITRTAKLGACYNSLTHTALGKVAALAICSILLDRTIEQATQTMLVAPKQ